MTINALIACDTPLLAALPAALVEPQDVFIVNGGARTLPELGATIGLARDIYPGNRVWLQTGPNRLRERSVLEADQFLIDWEQATWRNATTEEWTWDWPETKERIYEWAAPVLGRYGLTITAAPLVNRRRRREGVYWHYPDLTDMAEHASLMTQGFLRRSPLDLLIDAVTGNTDFELGIARLVEQFTGASRVSALGQVSWTVSFGDSYPNAVSPSLAVRATRVALQHGIQTVHLFGRDAARVQRYLELMGRGVAGSAT